MARSGFERLLVFAVRTRNAALIARLYEAAFPSLTRYQIPDVKFELVKYNDAEYRTLFRFSREELAVLVVCLRLPATFTTKERTCCGCEEGICLLLRRLVVPDVLFDIMPLFGRSPSAMSSIVYYMLGHLVAAFEEVLYLDRDRIANQLSDFSRAIAAKGAEIENVWAFIDGTVRACCRPTGRTTQHSLYNGHKREHAVKFQTLVTSDGIISHIFGPVEGCLHDITVLRKSHLAQHLEDDPRFAGCIIYGDLAYGNTDHFGSKFNVKLSASQAIVNKSMNRVHVSVEWSYAQIVQYWKFVDSKGQMKISEKSVA